MLAERRMSRRALLKVGLGLGASSLLAACAPKVVKETVVVEKVVEKEVTAVPSGEEEITISYMVRAGYIGDLERLFVRKFEDEYPIRVKTVDTAYADILKKMQAMAAAGNLPDVLTVACKWGPYMAAQAAFMPLDDLLEPHWEEYQIDDVYPCMLQQGRLLLDDLYWLPKGGTPGPRPLIIYNADMLEEAGIPLPDVKGWDIYEWREAAIKLTNLDEGIFGAMAPLIQIYYDWEAFVDGFDGHFMVEDVGLAKKFDWIDNPKVKEAWDWYKGLAIDGHVTPKRGETMEKVNMFVAGKAATSFAGTYQIPGLPEEVGDKFRWGATLQKGPVRAGSGMFCEGLALASQSKHAEEGLKLAWWLTRAEVGIYSETTGIGGGGSGRRSALNHPEVLAKHPIKAVIAQFWEEDLCPFPQPWNLRQPELYTTYLNLVEPLMYGEVTWEKQAPVIQEKCQEIMDQPRP